MSYSFMAVAMILSRVKALLLLLKSTEKKSNVSNGSEEIP